MENVEPRFGWLMLHSTGGPRGCILLLGMTTPLLDESTGSVKSIAVDEVVQLVTNGKLSQSHGRDLARSRATAILHNVDVHTVSLQEFDIDDDFHVSANFNRDSFCGTVKEAFRDHVFSQIVLDYFWITSSDAWKKHHWAYSFFTKTLPNFVKMNMIVPGEGVVYLPFCLYCMTRIISATVVLSEHYTIEYVKSTELQEVLLWSGTMTIDPNVMKNVFGKDISQEDKYCTISMQNVKESLDDDHVTKAELLKVLLSIEDLSDIRMIKLRAK